MEEGVDKAIAICSGKFEVTFLLSLGSVRGRSSLPRRREGLKRRVLGVKGPSSVVGMWSAETAMDVKRMRLGSTHLRKGDFLIWVV